MHPICIVVQCMTYTHANSEYNLLLLRIFISQSHENAFCVPTYCHSLKAFPEFISQLFFHRVPDIYHLIFIVVQIVGFNEFLEKSNPIKKQKNSQ